MGLPHFYAAPEWNGLPRGYEPNDYPGGELVNCECCGARLDNGDRDLYIREGKYGLLFFCDTRCCWLDAADRERDK